MRGRLSSVLIRILGFGSPLKKIIMNILVFFLFFFILKFWWLKKLFYFIIENNLPDRSGYSGWWSSRCKLCPCTRPLPPSRQISAAAETVSGQRLMIKIFDRQHLHIPIPNHILPPHPASHTFMCALAPQGKQRNQN